MHGLVKMMLTISCTGASVEHYLYRLLRIHFCIFYHGECLTKLVLILHCDVKMNDEKVYKTFCMTNIVINCLLQ